MLRPDLKALGDAVILAVRGYVGTAMASLAARLDDLDTRLKSFPHPERGDKGDKGDRGDDALPVDVARVVAEVAALVPAPAPGEPGKSVTVDDVAPIIREAVTREVAALPPPAKADPAEIAGILLRAIAEMPKPEPVDIAALAAQAAALVPKPEPGEPGKSVTLDDLRPLVSEAAQAAVLELPKAKDPDPELIPRMVAAAAGVTRDELMKALEEAATQAKAEILAHANQAIEALPKPDPSAITEDVLDQVMKAFDAIPAPENGKDADPEFVRSELARLVSALPPAEPGKDADPAVIAAMLAQAVAKIEIPKPNEVDQAVIRAEVERQMAEIPKPRDGEDVPLEVTQALIVGEVAKAFAAMPKPTNGDPGRDALQLDILPMIDETKSYPRNSLAWHRGGYWHAWKNTDGMDGWTCQMKGIVEETEELQADERTTVRTTRYSDGSTWVRESKSTAVIWRGIWKETDVYERFDSATRDGSTWVLMKDKQTGKPGDEHSGWVLSSKRGQDGKTIRGDKGDRGPPGKNGTDLTQLGGTGQRY